MQIGNSRLDDLHNSAMTTDNLHNGAMTTDNPHNGVMTTDAPPHLLSSPNSNLILTLLSCDWKEDWNHSNNEW